MLFLLSAGGMTSLRSKVPLLRFCSVLARWPKMPEDLGEAATGDAPTAPLGFGDVRPPSSSEAGLLWEPGLSFSRAFLRDMVQPCQVTLLLWDLLV